MTALERISQHLQGSREHALRVLHGRGRAYEGWEQCNVEWYPPYLFVQHFGDKLAPHITETLQTVFEQNDIVKAVLVQQREWPDFVTRILCQRLETQLPWQGWVKLADDLEAAITLGKNRNTGAFLDMRAGWQWLAENAAGKKVLNLFCYTGIFSLFALKGGAERVDNVDMAANVLKIAQRNHQHNHIHDGKAAFYKRDILKSARWFESRQDYDLIILDPPPYQKKAFHGWRDYQKLLQIVQGSLKPGGQLFCCLNNPQVCIEEFKTDLALTFSEASSMQVLSTAPEIEERDVAKGLKTIIVQP